VRIAPRTVFFININLYYQSIIVLLLNLGKKLLQQTPYFLQNFHIPNLSKKDTVTSSLPDVDILCIQEVWERYWAATLIDQLGSKYSYFIHGMILAVKHSHWTFFREAFCTLRASFHISDVGDHRLKSNYCLFGKYDCC
jgi:hypothetical protein